ncbi:uncharacterized protein [Physcomitrium patens]
MNKSPWSQRLRFIKPSGDKFSMFSKEDPFQGKILISGMFCRFDVVFKPRSAIDCSDEIQVQSEMDTVVITLKSINPFPIVVFPHIINLGYCLTNHSVAASYTFTCKEAGAHFAMYGFCNDLEWTLMGTKWTQDPRYVGLQERYIEKNLIFFPPFLAYPQETKLKKNETQDLIVLFQPSKCGPFGGVLQIETSMGRHWEILVKGHGVALQVTCNKFDGREWRVGEFERGIPFGSCTIGTTSSHFVSIKNDCEVPLRFYWLNSKETQIASTNEITSKGNKTSKSVVQENIGVESQLEFVIKPTFGVIPALSEMEAIVSFTPTNFKSYQQMMCLYVDTRASHPLASNNWKHVKNELLTLENENGSGMSVGTQPYNLTNEELTIERVDNMGSVFKVLEFPTSGCGIPIDVQCIPSFLSIAGGLTIGTVRNYKIKIQNNSGSKVKFSWERPKTVYDNGVCSNAVYFEPFSGEIQGYEHLDVNAIVKARKVGSFHKVCRCLITSLNESSKEGAEIFFQISGHTRGPCISITPAVIDYGLIQIGSTYNQDLILTNESGCQATFKLYTVHDPEHDKILTSRGKPVSLSSYGDALQGFKMGFPSPHSCQQTKNEQFGPTDLIESFSLVKVCRRVWYPKGVPYPEDDLQQKIIFHPSSGVLEKEQSCTIRAILKGTRLGYMRLAIICNVAELTGPTSMAVARAEIDAPRACLLPPMMDLGIQYLHCKIERTVILKNLRALPVCYNWWNNDGVGDHKQAQISWSQGSGKIPPRGEVELTFTFDPQGVGPFECILVCEVWKQQFPLGLLLKAFIVDIQVSFHVFRLEVDDGYQQSGRSIAFERIGKLQHERMYGRPSISGGRCYKAPSLDDPKVPCLDFGRRNIVHRVHSFKLLIQNHSPIEANVHVRVTNHPSEPEFALVEDELWMLSALTGHLSTLTVNHRDPYQSALTNKAQQFPSLAPQDANHSRFFSSMGKSMVWRRIEGAMHEAMIKEGQSVGFLIYPLSTGVLQPWSEWSCEVVCFSTLPGFYKDTLVVKIGQLLPFYIPVEIELVGNPLVSRINYLEPSGLQDIKETPELVLTWNTMPVGNPVVRRAFWIYNTSPFNMVVEWQIMKPMLNEDDLDVKVVFDIEENHENMLHCMLIPERNGEDWIIRVCIQEHLGIDFKNKIHLTFQDFMEPYPKAETPPFRIVPQKQVILGQRSSQFSVTFQCSEAASYKAIFIGRTLIHDGQFQLKAEAPQFAFDSTLEKLDKQFIYRRPSTMHVCEHVVTYFNKRTSQFQSLLVHKTSVGDHVHLEQLNQRKSSKKGGAWAEFGRKKSGVHRLNHEDDMFDQVASDEIAEEGNYAVSVLDIPNALITDAFAPNQEIDLIQPLRVTVVARLVVPRLYCNVDDNISFLVHGSLPIEQRFETKSLFLTNTYLERILFSIVAPPPFYVLNATHGIVEPITDGAATRCLSIIKDPVREPEPGHYRLLADWTLQLSLRFRPLLNDGDWYPEDEVIEQELVISFQDRHKQIITMYGDIRYPEVTLQTEILSFGTVVCPDCARCQDFTISNTSVVPLDWRIVTEKSHLDMVECAELDGFVNWQHLKDLNKRWPVIWKATPESGRIPGREGCMGEVYKQIVTITFSPFEPLAYAETIWIEAFRGRGHRLVLEGQGSAIITPRPVVGLAAPAATAGTAKASSKMTKRKSSAKI